MAPQSCSDWQDAQHALFQLANLCVAISKYQSFFISLASSDINAGNVKTKYNY
jgi:hypothetical protein